MDIQLVFYHSFSGKPQFEMPAGSRPWYIVMLLSGGSFRCRMDGKTFTAGAGETVCFPPDIYFEREIIKPLTFHQFGFSVPVDDPCAALLAAGKLPLTAECVNRAIALLDHAALSSLHDSAQLHRYVIAWLMMENMLALEQHHPSAETVDADIAQAIYYMNSHLEEKISVEQLAEMLHLSYTGFLFKFRKTMQCTPNEYLIRLRMQRARQLLLEGRLQIQEVAGLCGYSNAYYFSNAFRRCYGMSPSACRRDLCRNVPESVR